MQGIFIHACWRARDSPWGMPGEFCCEMKMNVLTDLVIEFIHPTRGHCSLVFFCLSAQGLGWSIWGTVVNFRCACVRAWCVHACMHVCVCACVWCVHSNRPLTLFLLLAVHWWCALPRSSIQAIVNFFFFKEQVY